ncbi:hypothetical protein D7316_04203 [Gordonia insulae]|uniref:Uncharacterized protein n=1 Tax=Gordonia insulae TaxID=2420509 RepID=A0A3G8JR30_9ACTN|nr:hypothetical protein D7316_04203 [Gordonia insulae]
MTHDDATERNENRPTDSTPKDQAPGPVDNNGQGGMATREVAPELVHTDDRDDEESSS